jgi:hypothetical protein
VRAWFAYWTRSSGRALGVTDDERIADLSQRLRDAREALGAILCWSVDRECDPATILGAIERRALRVLARIGTEE